eukprot:scaffold297_cov386-Prasinococcus_capsulatus_cf.AAC.4
MGRRYKGTRPHRARPPIGAPTAARVGWDETGGLPPASALDAVSIGAQASAAARGPSAGGAGAYPQRGGGEARHGSARARPDLPEHMADPLLRVGAPLRLPPRSDLDNTESLPAGALGGRARPAGGRARGESFENAMRRDRKIHPRIMRRPLCFRNPAAAVPRGAPAARRVSAGEARPTTRWRAPASASAPAARRCCLSHDDDEMR